MEDQCFNNIMWPMNYFDELGAISMAASFGENLHQSFSHPTYDIKPSVETPHPFNDRPTKQLKPNSWVSCNTDHMSNPQPNSFPINHGHPFVDSNFTKQVSIVETKEEGLSSKSTITLPSEMVSQGSFGNQNYTFNAYQGTKRMNTSTKLPQAQDHIIAERKRREKLSQKFIALSALIPGLKKMDKASVLGDAIKYLKQLQERLTTLEEQNKKSAESVVFVRKYELFVDGENSSLDENSGGLINEPLPEIEARFSDKDVLIRIHCEKKKGVLEKTVVEIEKFHLLVINSSAVTFGSNALDITIIAQMDKHFTLTAKDLVKNLRSALKQFM